MIRTPWSKVLPEDLTVPQPLKNLPAFYETRRFIAGFTTARHPYLSWARSIQSMHLHPISSKIHFHTIVPSMPRSSKWSLSRKSPHQDTVRTSPASHPCHMPRPSHSSWFYHPNNIWWKVQVIKLLVTYISFVTLTQAKCCMHEQTNSCVA